jgi:lipopolysaccharide/colanic/teichoic acid biosynthesis glycosyltransferase
LSGHAGPRPAARRRKPLLKEVDPGSAALRFYRSHGKRWLDIAVSSALLVLAMPLILVTALTVVAVLGRPIFYCQRRLGQNAAPITLVKFRSMRTDRRRVDTGLNRPDRRSGLPCPTDPRATRLGNFLRRWSLDELPQLAQVLRGELSLVGPRPELFQRLHVYSAEEMTRFEMKPGLTGAWQVTARDRSNDLHAGVVIDLDYVRRCSFGNDLRILLKTPAAVVLHPAIH